MIAPRSPPFSVLFGTTIEIGTIEKIVNFPAELYGNPLGDFSVLNQGRVPLAEARSTQLVTRGVAHRAIARNVERDSTAGLRSCFRKGRPARPQ